MKSSIFSGVTKENLKVKGLDVFKLDLAKLLKEKSAELLSSLLSIAENADKDEKSIDKIATCYKLSKDEITSLLSLVTFIGKWFDESEIEKAESIDYIIEDLMELELIEKENIEVVRSILEKVKNKWESGWNLRVKKEQISRKILPTVKSFYTSIEYRAVFKKESNVLFDINNYQSECIGITPVVTLQMSFKNTHLDKMVCQITPKELDSFIKILQRSQEDLKAANSYLGVKE